MNDFTKDELEILNQYLRFYESHQYNFDGGLIYKSDRELKIKLQSLIDNYCDHTWGDGSGNHIYCINCQAYGGKR